MNDFDYENLQKKRIARGAYHMKGGSKSKKCFLPSDLLTPAQIKKRSGPCMTYKLTEPMTWKEFKSMPFDLQAQYLEYIQDHFHTSLGNIGLTLFKLKSRDTIRNHILTNDLHIDIKPYLRSTNAEAIVFKNWCNGVVEPEEEAPAEEDLDVEMTVLESAVSSEEITETQVEEAFEPEPLRISHSDFHETLEGRYDYDTLRELLANIADRIESAEQFHGMNIRLDINICGDKA